MVRKAVVAIGLVLMLVALFFVPVEAAGEPGLVVWPMGDVQDQKDTPECVGFSLSTWMEAGPLAYLPGHAPDGHSIYGAAQVRDGTDEPHDGTSLEAGFGFLEDYGWVDHVMYTNDVDVLRTFVQFHGPAEMGTEWDYPMYTPDARGVITPGGFIMGYHAYVAYGFDRVNNEFLLQNSWGSDWGQHGQFRLSYGSMEYLLTHERSAYKEAALPYKGVDRWLQAQIAGW